MEENKPIDLPLATTGARCTWVCPEYTALSDEQARAVQDWLTAHGLDPYNITAAAVMNGNELHVTERLTDDQGRPIIDLASNRVAEKPRVVRLCHPTPFVTIGIGA